MFCSAEQNIRQSGKVNERIGMDEKKKSFACLASHCGVRLPKTHREARRGLLALI
jgi:hypothetical protein